MSFDGIRKTGEPNGVLEEEALDFFQDVLPPPSLLGGLRIARAASDLYVRAGVTTAQSGYTDTSLMQPLQWASRIGIVPVRLVIWPSPAAADEMLAGTVEFESYDPNWVRAGAVKLIADGSIQAYTGYLAKPYHVPPMDEEPDYRGYPRIPRNELIEAVGRYHSARAPGSRPRQRRRRHRRHPGCVRGSAALTAAARHPARRDPFADGT